MSPGEAGLALIRVAFLVVEEQSNPRHNHPDKYQKSSRPQSHKPLTSKTDQHPTGGWRATHSRQLHAVPQFCQVSRLSSLFPSLPYVKSFSLYNPNATAGLLAEASFEPCELEFLWNLILLDFGISIQPLFFAPSLFIPILSL